MDPPSQNPALLPCREYQLTSNHLHGEENCAECKLYNSSLKKPKKQLNLKAAAYEKKAHKLNLGADSYKFVEPKNEGQPLEEEEKAKFEDQDFQDDAAFAYEIYSDENEENEESDPNQNYHEARDLLELGETHLALYEKYRDCECCHGMVYRCEGEVCKNLEACYCLMKDQAEDSLKRQIWGHPQNLFK